MQELETKTHLDWKGRSKITSFTDDMILHINIFKKYIISNFTLQIRPKLQKTKHQVQNVPEYKINMQNTVASLYISKENMKVKFKESFYLS